MYMILHTWHRIEQFIHIKNRYMDFILFSSDSTKAQALIHFFWRICVIFKHLLCHSDLQKAFRLILMSKHLKHDTTHYKNILVPVLTQGTNRKRIFSLQPPENLYSGSGMPLMANCYLFSSLVFSTILVR